MSTWKRDLLIAVPCGVVAWYIALRFLIHLYPKMGDLSGAVY